MKGPICRNRLTNRVVQCNLGIWRDGEMECLECDIEIQSSF